MNGWLMFFVILFIIIVIIGALSGGKSFGETIREGIKTIVGLIILAGIGIWLYINYEDKKFYENNDFVCLYNDNDFDVNFSIDWTGDGDCVDDINKTISANGSAQYHCENVSKPPVLTLKWKGYKATSFNFPNTKSGKECSNSNSLTIGKSKVGYEWNVLNGKNE